MNNNPSPSIGLAISDLYDPYQKAIWSGINYQATEAGMNLLCFLGGSLNHEKEIYKYKNPLFNLINNKVIDVLLLLSGPLSIYVGLEGLQEFIEAYDNLPIVSIAVEIPGVPSVIVDNYNGMYELANHLIEKHNCKKIAFIRGPQANPEAFLRNKAYEDCLAAHNLPLNEKLIYNGNFWHTDGEDAINYLLKQNLAFDALLCSDDHSAVNAIAALQKYNKRIPEDIKVVGFDDIEISQYSNPSLTTTSQPLFELGTMAVQIAQQILENKKPPLVTKVKTHRILRESCGCSTADFLDSVTQNSLNHTRNSKKNDAILNSYARSLKFKGTFKPFKSIHEGYIEKRIKTVHNEVIEAIRTNFQNVSFNEILETTLNDTFKKGLNASFWRNIIMNIIVELQDKNYSLDHLKHFECFWNKALKTLYQAEARLRAFEKLREEYLLEQINRLGDKIITCFDLNKLKKILYDDLSIVSLNHCMICLFVESQQESRLIFYLNNKQSNLTDESVYDTNDILTRVLSGFEKNTFIITPLFLEEKQLGFALFGISDIPELAYEFMSEKLSRGFAGIEMMEQINNHTIELANKVAERTSELKKANIQLKELSMRDQLSGLRNRRFLMEIILPNIEQMLADFQADASNTNRRSNNNYKNIVIVMLDLDHFKSVNDTYGHHSGDLVLQQVSKLLLTYSRNNDYVIRMGGEEFLILLNNFNPDYTTEKIERIRREIEAFPFTVYDGTVIHRTCSMGVIEFPINHNDPTKIDFITAINLTDKALYYAKHHGRNKAIKLDINDVFFDKEIKKEYILNSFDSAIAKRIITITDTNPDIL